MKISSYPRFTLAEEISREQTVFFEKYGFLHFTNFINPETVKLFIRCSQEIQQKWIEQDVKKVNGTPVKYGRDLDGKSIVQRFAFASLHHPVLHEFLQDKRLQSVLPLLKMHGRIGEHEKDGLVINHYVNTESSEYTQLGWHTDAPRDIFLGKRIMPMLNVGIHLDDCPAENGGLRIIPGTHRQGLYGLFFRKKYFVDNDPDPEELAIVTQAGDLTIHDGRLWHRVAKSPLTGEKSRRRVMYIPIICGDYQPKNEHSKTPLYQRFIKLVK